MIHADRSDTWRSLYASGQLSRFIVLCLGIWLHAADTLVTATIAPAIVDDIGGVAYINWTIMLYEVGAIVGGAAAPMLCRRIGIKRLLQLAAFIYGGGCIIGALAPAMAVLLAGRLAQGLGGGILLSLCYLAIQAMVHGGLVEPAVRHRRADLGRGLAAGSADRRRVRRSARLAHDLRQLCRPGRGAVDHGLAVAAVADSPSPQTPPSPTPPPRTAKPWLPLLVLTAATLLIAQSSVAGAVSHVGARRRAGHRPAAAVRRAWIAAAGSRLFPVQVLDVRHPVGAGLLMVFLCRWRPPASGPTAR